MERYYISFEGRERALEISKENYDELLSALMLDNENEIVAAYGKKENRIYTMTIKRINWLGKE